MTSPTHWQTPFFFFYNNRGVLAYFLVYVDDLLLTGNNTFFLDTFMTTLAIRFSLKGMGTTTYFVV